ncbi:hypothetical protein F5884DRAFT_779084 [Xylogone sp. PMI_703]|nr:hypothetical protein F5884DRAFT_779084 [Xylogone sp. PMI_703]
MSLARRNNGCYECSRRRIKCDKTEPECLKCAKKGIQCSGQGIRYRFSTGTKLKLDKSGADASSETISETKLQNAPAVSPKPAFKGFRRWVTVGEESLRQRRKSSSGYSEVPPSEDDSTDTSSRESPLPLIEYPGSQEMVRSHQGFIQAMQFSVNTPLPMAIEVIDPQKRLLFDHFSTSVAPIMVVLDFISNGYRDIILPLACQDPVVGRAVSVVAAFHLSAKVPSLRQSAEAGQLAIISKLRRDSLQLKPHELFNISTWATILVLLVGETITGADNYRYLLEMLMHMVQCTGFEHAVPAAVRDFFVQQTKMFALFGFPLSHESKGVQTLRSPLEDNLGFMAYQLGPDSEHYSNLIIIKAAICDACEIYRRRAESCLDPEESIDLIERLRQTVLPISPETTGAHALVWTYFICAAESTLLEHRKFFSDRLAALYQYTQFQSIPAALKALDVIWKKQGTQKWTEVITNEIPVLVM